MQRHKSFAVKPRSGFTLVEMMVAVTLVMIMMLMFSTIFQIASGSMSTQRGIAVNDQKARTIATTIRADLQARTFISMVPFAALETPPASTDSDFALRDFTKRRGYFYISENDPDNNTDDILQFTVQWTSNDTPNYGRAKALGIPETAPAWSANTAYAAGTFVQPVAGNAGLVYYAISGGTSGATEPAWNTTPGNDTPDNGITWRAFTPTANNRNQPEWDDGAGGNESGSAQAAEVCYFLRHGILYRRVLLIRATLTGYPDAQPKDNTNQDYFDATQPGGYRGNFYSDFDYSAFYLSTKQGAEFHSSPASLENAGGGLTPLAIPGFRFGHYYPRPGATDPNQNQPKEYLDRNDANGDGKIDFIGRYTQEESSYQDFQYPHRIATTQTPPAPQGNVMRRNTPWGLTTRGAVNAFAGGTRRGEDIMMLNVQSFDVKVWDPLLGRFVDLGHNETDSGNPVGLFNQQDPTTTLPANYYNAGNRHVADNLTYGASTTVADNRIFDTWYPQLDLDGSNTTGVDDPATTTTTEGYDHPPFRAMDNNGTPMDPTDDRPLPLRAIQITITYHDPKSDQLRQITLVESLVE